MKTIIILISEWWIIITRSQYIGKYIIVTKTDDIVLRYWRNYPDHWHDRIDNEKKHFLNLIEDDEEYDRTNP